MLHPDTPLDICCGEPMDTWRNTIWCKFNESLKLAQLYACRRGCGNKHHRIITTRPEFGEIIID